MISHSQYTERTRQGISVISYSVYRADQTGNFSDLTLTVYRADQTGNFSDLTLTVYRADQTENFRYVALSPRLRFRQVTSGIPHSVTRWSFSIMRTKQSEIQPADVRSKMVRCFHKRFGFRTKPLGDRLWHYERSTYSHVCVI